MRLPWSQNLLIWKHFPEPCDAEGRVDFFTHFAKIPVTPPLLAAIIDSCQQSTSSPRLW
jgi:hypothetical protein